MESRMDQYEIMEQIGRGAFGAAILVNHKVEKKRYVLKKIRLARQTERCRRSAHQEMALIARIKHPFIVEYKEAWVEKGCYVCIVTGYCEGGDMAEMIKRLGEDVFPEEKLLKWFTQLLLAVEYLHSNFVLHRDLKCSNIFLTKEQDLRLGDFGLAKTLKADDLASSVVGTPNYMCPELLADIPYGFKSDIWSLGCCMYEMAAHRPAFKAFDMAGLISKINRSVIGPIPVCYSSSLKSLIKSMLRKNPEHRPSASQVLRHPCLQPYMKQYISSGPINATPSTPNTQEGLSESQNSRSSTGDKDKVPDLVKTHAITLKQPRTIKNILMAMKEENKPRNNSSPLRRNYKVNPRLPSKASEPAISSGSSSSKSNSDVSPKEKKALLPSPLEPSIKSKPGQLPPTKEIPKSLTSASKCLLKPPEVNKMMLCPAISSGPAEKQLQEDEQHNKIPVNSAQPNKNLPEAMELSFPSSDQEFVAMDEPELVLSTSPLKPKVMTSPFDEVIHVIRHSSFRVAGDEKPSSSESTQPKEDKEEDEDSKETLDLKSFRQRAEALEELLELSAELLQDNKLEELAVVLRPFGKDKVSPRETAIWLARSLKNMKMDDPHSARTNKTPHL